MNRTILTILAFIVGAPLLSVPAYSQISPGKKDIPAAKKIYSPYVERTVNDKNFAEAPGKLLAVGAGAVF